MSFKSEDASVVYGKELALFRVPSTNSGVDKVQWIEYRPISNAG